MIRHESPIEWKKSKVESYCIYRVNHMLMHFTLFCCFSQVYIRKGQATVVNDNKNRNHFLLHFSNYIVCCSFHPHMMFLDEDYGKVMMRSEFYSCIIYWALDVKLKILLIWRKFQYYFLLNTRHYPNDRLLENILFNSSMKR